MAEKKPRPKKTFKTLTATTLAFSLVAGNVYAQDNIPSFEKSCVASVKEPRATPRAAMRKAVADPAVREQQRLLKKLGFDPGTADGRAGPRTRDAIREYQMFYGPLQGQTGYSSVLDAEDVVLLRSYVTKAEEDAKLNNRSVQESAAIRLAASRTGVEAAKIVEAQKALSEAPPDAFLWLVSTEGDKYGLSFYAKQIELKQEAGVTAATVKNPFVERQLLELKNHPRLSRLLAAEYSKAQATAPVFAQAQAPVFDAALKQQQRDLNDLGFNAGPADGMASQLSDIAMREFKTLYGNASLHEAAERARADSRRMLVPSEAVGAIRMASEKTGVEFGYMMELAAAESSFITDIGASTSGATGLYQFIEPTWHQMIHEYGAKYGMTDLAGEIESYTDAGGIERVRVNNPIIRAQLAEMRIHPHLSAIFGAEFQLENKRKLPCDPADSISRADLYMSHFLGSEDGAYFLSQMGRNPNQSAADLFPAAAGANEGVFYTLSGEERSLKQVHALFSKKFNRGRYDDPPPVEGTMIAANKPSPAGPKPTT